MVIDELRKAAEKLYENTTPVKQPKIWANSTTIEVIKKNLKSMQGNEMVRFSGIQVYLDDSLPDFFLETEENRNLRFGIV